MEHSSIPLIRIMSSMLILSKFHIFCTIFWFDNRVQFIFRHPKSINAANVFLLPFESMVWYATISLCLLSAFVVRVTFSLEKQLSTEKKDKNQEELNEESNSNSMLMVFGFIFQQSTSIVSYPKS